MSKKAVDFREETFRKVVKTRTPKVTGRKPPSALEPMARGGEGGGSPPITRAQLEHRTIYKPPQLRPSVDPKNVGRIFDFRKIDIEGK